MATGGAPRDEVFVDATFAIALINVRDQLHNAALTAAQQVKTAGVRLVTTQAVMLEIGNALSKKRFRGAAMQLLASLRDDPTVEIIPLSSSLFERALALFGDRQDKEWGLVDCLSFVVMDNRGIHQVLSADEHFEQAGFVAILRTSGMQ